ncbi:FACT complex subunit SSRP1 [Balamuthia mandrillaris]
MELNDTLQFGEITLADNPNGSGTLKINPKGLGWRTKAGRTVGVIGTEVKKVEWINAGIGYQLKVSTKEGPPVRLAGFRDRDYEPLRSFFDRHFRLELQKVELSTKGWNWGETELKRDTTLLFRVAGAPAFEIPLKNVAQCVLHNKNEVSLEFHQDDTTISPDTEALVEIRFNLPAAKDEEGGAADFHKKILRVADVAPTAGGGLLVFKDVAVLTPRGRYDVEMYSSFLRLHGKTYDYKILFSSIYRLFELPKPDNKHVCFVISLDPPIRQGNTFYHHLVLQFSKEQKTSLEVNMAELEATTNKNKSSSSASSSSGSKLQENMSGKTYKLFRRVFRELVQIKFTTPGTFSSYNESFAVKCSVKANDGYLFPLESSFFFIHKPPTFVRYSEVSMVEFSRVSSGLGAGAGAVSNRTFDLIVNLKAGGDVQFTGIQRNEFKGLFQFIHKKGMPVKKITDINDASRGQVVEGESSAAVQLDDEDEDSEEAADDDFVAGDEEGEVPEEYDEMGAEPLEEEIGLLSGEEDEEEEEEEEDEENEEKEDGKQKRKKRKTPSTPTSNKSEKPSKSSSTKSQKKKDDKYGSEEESDSGSEAEAKERSQKRQKTTSSKTGDK